MQIEFRTRKLQRQYESSKDAERAFGKSVARKYIERVNIMKSVRNLDELIQINTLKCHPLKGDRAGEWTVRLKGFYRLIFTPKGENLEIACIEEVSKHYDN